MTVATIRERDPFRVITPALKWKEALEDLIDAAAEDSVLIGLPEVECCGCCVLYHSAPEVEFRDMRSDPFTTEQLDIEYP